MDIRQTNGAFTLEAILPAERARLVRLCARISGDRDIAEDLAQETLIEAWRHRHRLYDKQGYDRWLSAIARNVCRRWAHHNHRMLSPLADRSSDHDLIEQVADPFDLEVALERDELATLLDRAMALLPPTTRAMLVEHYIQEMPLADVADRLGLSEGTVAVRLHRGRLALRRVLATDLCREAAVYGLTAMPRDEWQNTALWCPHCGKHRLAVRLTASDGSEFWTRCPDCQSEAGAYFVRVGRRPAPAESKGYRRMFARVIKECNSYFRRALVDGTARCGKCGHTVPVHMCRSDGTRLSPGTYIVGADCPVCVAQFWTYHTELILYLPEGGRFWRKQRRIRTLPEQKIEVDGRAALVTRFESLTSKARLEVISASDTAEVISLHESTR